MSQFNVHEWNRKRRLAALNEGFTSDVIRGLKQMYNDFKINSKGEDRETMSRLNFLMDIIEKAYDLYDLQAIDKEILDGIIEKYGQKFQDEIDNASDSFIKYTDFERSTDE